MTRLFRSPTARRIAQLALALGLAAAPFAKAEEAAPPAEAKDPAIGVNASLTGVVQQVNAAGSEDGIRTARASGRGDVALTLPAGNTGDAESELFTHIRFGQGRGIVLRPTYTSTPNTTAYAAAAGPTDSYAVVAEAWYKLTVPLARSGPESRAHLELTLGKMDPFAFFDQNAVADDETVRFLDNAFVHNPLLDSGGDTGTDAYGFAPGVRIAYVEGSDEAERWGASLAVFGSGPGAHFGGSFDGPFVIGQVQATRRFVAGLPGTYRAYAWTNGRTTDFSHAFERHTGLGISADQRVGDAATLWGRLGYELRGHVGFDRALTLGAEIDGGYWRRRDDAIGLAAGFLRTSPEYRDATADGTLAGYAASGTERIVELYYRWHVKDDFDVTPDLQWIRRPGGDASASDVFVAGVRARVGF